MPGDQSSWNQWQREVPDLIKAIKNETRKTYTVIFHELGGQEELRIDEEGFTKRRLGRVPTSLDFVQKLVKYCKIQKIRADIPESIRDVTYGGPKNLTFDIRAAVGLTENGTLWSIKRYSGMHWLIFWAENNQLAVLRCRLYSRPHNGVPFYRTCRRDVLGAKVQRGTYFAEGDHLFLTGTRQDRVEVRLSVFHCNPSHDAGRVLRGITSGVDSHNDLFSSPSVLFRSNAIPDAAARLRDAYPALHPPEKVSDWFGDAVTHVLNTPSVRLGPIPSTKSSAHL